MDDLDKAIDDVAREVVAGEPDPGFKTRVLAGVDALAVGRQSWRPGRILSSLSVAAVVIVVAVAIARTQWRLAPATTVPSADANVRLDPDTSIRPPTEAREVRPQPYTGQTRPPRIALRRAMSEPGEAGQPDTTYGSSTDSDPVAAATAITPLVSPRLEIEPIGIDAMEAMESIEVPGLALTALEVPAL